MSDPRLLPSACHDGIDTPDCIAFAAQYLAYTRPCQRFADCLAAARASFGVSVDRYSFTVTDLHRLPPADLPARHRQLDWLWSRQGRRGRPHERLCPSGHAGDLGPGLEGLGPGGSILAGGAVIAAEVEEVVDLVVSGEEALGLTG